MDKYVSGFADGNIIFCPFCGGDNIFQRSATNAARCCDCHKEFYVIVEEDDEIEE